MNYNRRTFLRQASLGLSSALLSPYLFSCESGNSGKGPFQELGLQLYSIRDLLKQDPVNSINTIAKIGYKHVETVGFDVENPSFWGLSIPEFKKLLKDNKLQTHTGQYNLRKYLTRGENEQEHVEKYIEVAHELGQSYIVAPASPMDKLNELNSADYQYAADQLNKLGEMTQKAGIRVAYHNHFWEFRNLGNGTKGLDVLLAFTDPKLVDFEFDIFWAEKAGISPQTYFERYPGRFPLWHIKDMDRQYTESIVGKAYDQLDRKLLMEKVRYTEVGSGVINFERLLPYASKAKLQYAFVEQDEIYLPNKFKSLKISYDYIIKHLGKR